VTSQTKHYIELSDILTLRFDCKNPKCGASLTASVRDFRQNALNYCPLCKEGWALINGTTCEAAIGDFIDAFRKLERMLGSSRDFPAGFNLRIEIKEPEREQK